MPDALTSDIKSVTTNDLNVITDLSNLYYNISFHFHQSDYRVHDNRQVTLFSIK